jgi:hypothetical protein
MIKVNYNNVQVTFSLDEGDEGDGFANGIVTTAGGRRIDVGGGWILDDVAATAENNRRGVNLSACPNWPNAVYAGEILPYDGLENGDVAGLAEVLGCDEETAIELVQAATVQAWRVASVK